MYERSEPLRVLTPPAPGAAPAAPLVIFGAPRGGTSMVAGALRLLGADLGDRLGDGNNEDLDLLEARGPVRAFIEDDEAACAAAAERIRDWLKDRRAAAPVHGWKDPHAALYLPHIMADLPAPRLIAVFRDPAACAERVSLLTGADRPAVLRETLRLYAAAADVIEDDRAASAMVSYEKALVRPKRFLKALAEFAGLSPDRAQYEAALNFVSPERGHGNPDRAGWPREGAL